MIEAGITDSFQVVRSALLDGISIGSSILTTECVIYKEKNYTRK